MSSSRLVAWPAWRTRSLLLLVLAAAFLLHLPRLLMPALIWDDFEILTDSWPWEVMRAKLWYSANEHVMPLGRLSTWAMVEATPRLTWLPWVTALQGPLAVLAGMLLLYRFVSQERGHPIHGLAAMALFGVTTNYIEAVSWFSASFSILAIDTLLLGLLAAQGWRQSGRKLYLLGCAVAVALAPCWFAIGILAGPVCLLYLLFPQRDERRWLPWPDWSPWCWTPLLGTAAFLAVSLPLTAQRIMHLEHYGDKTAVQSFDLFGGAVNTARALTDTFVLGSLGLPSPPLPAVVSLTLAPLWLVLLLWWWRRAPHQGLVLTGAGCLFGNYLLIHGARAAWDYELVASWTRYNLAAQLGLALIVAGGLPDWRPEWDRNWRWLILGVLVLTMLHLPRSWPDFPPPSIWKEKLAGRSFSEAAPEVLRETHHQGERHRHRQRADLARVDALGARCRAHRISAAQAEAAMGDFFIAGSSYKASGWKLLRGSDDPAAHTSEEVRRLLTDEADSGASDP